MKVIRSPLYYLGDKYKIFRDINVFFPKKIDSFYDVFGGGGTLLANIVANKYIYNDFNVHLTNLLIFFYKNPRKKIFLEIKKIMNNFKLNDFYIQNKEEFKNNYNSLKEEYNIQKNKNTFYSNALFFVLIVHSFNSQIRFNLENKFNVPVGKQTFNKNRIETFNSFIDNIKNKKIIFNSQDFSFINSLLEKGDLKKEDFLYFDPPYLLTNATYNSFWDEKKEVELLNLLDKLNENKIKWALSNVFDSKGKENVILKKWSQKYNVHFIKSNYTNSNYQRKNRNTKDVEVLITNYEDEKFQ